MPRSLVLSLDTSTPVLSCALLARETGGVRVLGTRTAAPPAIVSTLVPGLFDELLAAAGASLEDVSVVVSGLGPGLFTGARVSVATMKAIAYARRIPLVGAGSLEAMAYAAARGSGLKEGDFARFDEKLASGWLCPIIDARKGEVYFAVHRFVDGTLETHAPPNAGPPDAVREMLETSAASPKAVGAALKVLGMAPVEPLWPTAAEIAFVALQRDPAPVFDLARVLAVEPTYIRPPEAEVARQRRELEKATFGG